MCEFHESTCNGFGDIWWTDNPIHFSSIDVKFRRRRRVIETHSYMCLQTIVLFVHVQNVGISESFYSYWVDWILCRYLSKLHNINISIVCML